MGGGERKLENTIYIWVEKKKIGEIRVWDWVLSRIGGLDPIKSDIGHYFPYFTYKIDLLITQKWIWDHKKRFMLWSTTVGPRTTWTGRFVVSAPRQTQWIAAAYAILFSNLAKSRKYESARQIHKSHFEFTFLMHCNWYHTKLDASKSAMKGSFSVPGDYIYFKSQVPLHKIPVSSCFLFFSFLFFILLGLDLGCKYRFILFANALCWVCFFCLISQLGKLRFLIW